MSNANKYNFSVKLDTGKYTVEIDPVAKYGYFEHNTLGDESGGGLWFETNEEGKLGLTDYDGMSYLPKNVIGALRQLGYVVTEDFE